LVFRAPHTNRVEFWDVSHLDISDLIMNNENGVETLTNSDKDKTNTLSDFFSIIFTTETTYNYRSLEGINISYNKGTLVIDENQIRYTNCSFCLGFRILPKLFRIFLNIFVYFYFLIHHCFSSKLFTWLRSLQYSLYLSPSRVSINLDQHRQYTKSKTKTTIGISDLIMNDENGVETLTNSDKDKANTLSDFFSSIFTTETTYNYRSLEGI
jgi:hypothetical protein